MKIVIVKIGFVKEKLSKKSYSGKTLVKGKLGLIQSKKVDKLVLAHSFKSVQGANL